MVLYLISTNSNALVSPHRGSQVDPPKWFNILFREIFKAIRKENRPRFNFTHPYTKLRIKHFIDCREIPYEHLPLV